MSLQVAGLCGQHASKQKRRAGPDRRTFFRWACTSAWARMLDCIDVSVAGAASFTGARNHPSRRVGGCEGLAGGAGGAGGALGVALGGGGGG